MTKKSIEKESSVASLDKKEAILISNESKETTLGVNSKEFIDKKDIVVNEIEEENYDTDGRLVSRKRSKSYVDRGINVIRFDSVGRRERNDSFHLDYKSKDNSKYAYEHKKKDVDRDTTIHTNIGWGWTLIFVGIGIIYYVYRRYF